MSLKLSLAQTGLTWTLNPDQDKTQYIVGTERHCDIRLPDDALQPCPSIQLDYSPEREQWSLRRLTNNQGISAEASSEPITPIFDQSHIRLNSNLLLIAHLSTTDLAKPSKTSLITSTRLLCGYAYKEGIFGGFELLNQLRSDPYKGKFSKSSIDTDQVTRHSTQAILISTLIASAVLFVSLLQWVILYFRSAGAITSMLLEPSPLLVTISLVSGLAIAFETVYFRWFFARKFLKKHYDSEFSIKPLEPLSDYLRQDFYHPINNQNVIVFGSYAPFVGAGEPIPSSRWTVPITRRLKAEKETGDRYVDISAREFHKWVDDEIGSLDLPQIQKTSQLFVDGFELAVDGKLLDKPIAQPAAIYLDNPIWNEEQQDSSSRLRAYRLYCYVDIERDYVLSHFLRFYNAGEITFIESAAYILTGIDRQRYSLTSTLDDSHLTRILKTLLVGVFLGVTQLYILLAGWYIGCFLYNILSWRNNDKKQRRAAEFQEEYNYGVEQTLREYVAEPLNLEENRKLHPNRATNRGQSFLARLNLRKIFSNPILLFAMFVLGPILLPFAIFIAVFMWFLNRFKETVGTFSTNLDYYGTQDIFMYWKAIQNGIFSGAIKLLKDKGVDTSTLEGVSSQIINNSVTVSAGNITGSQVVIGSDISSTQSKGNAQP